MSVFKTTDLYLAAYLKTAGLPLLVAEKSDSDRVVFIFTRIDSVLDLKRAYFKKESKVCALEYADNIKSLKVLIHGFRV